MNDDRVGLRHLRASNLATSPYYAHFDLNFNFTPTPPMPKVVAPRSSARGPLADGAVKIKTVDRGRNKSGRPRAANVKTSVVLPPPKRKPAPSPPPVSLDLHPGDSGSEDEQEIQLPTQKGPSRAVSVSSNFSCDANSR